jgi:hypothetical protein
MFIYAVGTPRREKRHCRSEQKGDDGHKAKRIADSTSRHGRIGSDGRHRDLQDMGTTSGCFAAGRTDFGSAWILRILSLFPRWYVAQL